MKKRIVAFLLLVCSIAVFVTSYGCQLGNSNDNGNSNTNDNIADNNNSNDNVI